MPNPFGMINIKIPYMKGVYLYLDILRLEVRITSYTLLEDSWVGS